MLYLVIIKNNNMNKETAVEWFVKELFKKIDYIQVDPKLIEQAIAMEKEQTEDAFSESRLTHPMIGFKHLSFNDYFNETYGGDK